MCAFFHVSAISTILLFFFQRMVPYKTTWWEEMGNVNGAQCKSGTLVCTRCLTYCQRSTYTKQRGKKKQKKKTNPLDLMLQWYLCALCIIHLACEIKKKKLVFWFWFFFFFSPHLNSLLYQYSVTGQFHFEHDKKCFFAILLKNKCFSNCCYCLTQCCRRTCYGVCGTTTWTLSTNI